MRRILVSLFIASATLLGTSAVADVEEKLTAAMAAETRSDKDRARDANRRPIETLKFFGLKEDMRVLELLPGGGWYSNLLAPVLAEDGKLLVAVGTQGIEKMQSAGAFADVEVVEIEDGEFGRAEGSKRYHVEKMKLKTKNIDLALTFRNLHNLDAETRDLLNREVFRVLRKGGLYGVIDHTRRHMQSDNDENWRRMDPVQMIKEIEAAGFKFVDQSDLHYRYDDDLVYEVGRRSVSGNTDRFTLLFKKP